MKAMLIDAYRNKDKIIVWLKTPDENIRLERDFVPKMYLENTEIARQILLKFNLPKILIQKITYQGELKKVYEIEIKEISKYESFVRRVEQISRHRLVMYNADISPEQMFLYKNNLKPFSIVEFHNNNIFPTKEEYALSLEKIKIKVIPTKDIRINHNAIVKEIIINNNKLIGLEKNILKEFTRKFISIDPDVILMDDAFSILPYLVNRLKYYNLDCPFHRWDYIPIKKKGGKAFFSYGRVIYRDFAIRLNGRFLIDSKTTVGSECGIDSITELSNISGTRFQQIASRSFGSVFQSSLIREMVRRNYLVPFKEKPVDKPISMYHLLKFDRVGHTFDSITGLHHDVAEIDFSSLFPWIIYNYNISTETILRGNAPYQNVPGLPLKISLEKKGIVPVAIKPLLDRRMHYKKNPTSLNKAKTQGLKWVLVTSYGYLRFREFKLGMASSHMAIGAFARVIMMRVKEICEEHGFKIVHGIVDSLYIQKKGISEKKVKEVCREIELEIGIPLSFEGLFKWIVFLPSVNDIDRPVPTRYYGVFKNGEIKVRGIEARQASSPKIIKKFQIQCLKIISSCNNKDEIKELFTYLCQILKKVIFLLPTMDSDMLTSSIRISKTEYKSNIPQKRAVFLLKEKGISVLAGQKVNYLFSNNKVILPEDYKHNPDIDRYKKLLVRSLFVILQPFGFTKEEINELTNNEKQSKLFEFYNLKETSKIKLEISNQIKSFSFQLV